MAKKKDSQESSTGGGAANYGNGTEILSMKSF